MLVGQSFCWLDQIYADDLTLICPSAKGLQAMLNICETYAAEYGVLYL